MKYHNYHEAYSRFQILPAPHQTIFFIKIILDVLDPTNITPYQYGNSKVMMLQSLPSQHQGIFIFQKSNNIITHPKYLTTLYHYE